MEIIQNPFRPGAGQKPLYLAGRQEEQQEFLKALMQKPVMQNLIITGLRGVGKTVLLDALKPVALANGWLWAGTDLSESASISERNLSHRIITDLSSVTASFPAVEVENPEVGFSAKRDKVVIAASYQYLTHLYEAVPGLSSDKLKYVLETVWNIVKTKVKGIVLAYDEAQILKDQSADKEFPLSLLLEVVQFLQRKEIPYLLVLTGLPTLFPNLVETRTYAERMFHVMQLNKLGRDATTEAIKKPIQMAKSPVTFNQNAIDEIIRYSGGYPYFIQFLCKEMFDTYILQKKLGIDSPIIPLEEVIRKLDTDFYSGRWSKATDRQKDLMVVIAQLPAAEEEFSVMEIVEKSKECDSKGFSSSQANQILSKLVEMGLIYKNRHGKYSFAVPMLSQFIKRQSENGQKEG